jgi:hypothetical protein
MITDDFSSLIMREWFTGGRGEQDPAR